MMKRINVSIHHIVITLCLILTAGLMFQVTTRQTEAASEYKQLWASGDTRTVEKSGKYYFKWNSNSNTILMSTNKTSGYTATPLTYGTFSNGKQACYIRDNRLYKYVFSTRKETFLKKFSLSGDQVYSISTVYSSQVFLTKSSFEQWKFWTYSYNIKTKKLKLAKSNCNITDRYGKYVIAQGDYRTDIAPYPLTVYKITSSGLSKVKKISSYGKNAVFIGSKLYYVTYPKGTMKKATLYRSKPDGSSPKKIASFSVSTQYGEVIITKITSKYCNVSKFQYKPGKSTQTTYRYTYADKKLKKIS